MIARVKIILVRYFFNALPISLEARQPARYNDPSKCRGTKMAERGNIKWRFAFRPSPSSSLSYKVLPHYRYRNRDFFFSFINRIYYFPTFVVIVLRAVDSFDLFSATNSVRYLNLNFEINSKDYSNLSRFERD